MRRLYFVLEIIFTDLAYLLLCGTDIFCRKIHILSVYKSGLSGSDVSGVNESNDYYEISDYRCFNRPNEEHVKACNLYIGLCLVERIDGNHCRIDYVSLYQKRKKYF